MLLGVSERRVDIALATTIHPGSSRKSSSVYLIYYNSSL